MDKADRYITKLRSLYRLDERVITALMANKAKLENSLKPFYWEDIQRCIEKFYAVKDSTNYPRIDQLVAMLNTDKNVGVEIQETELEIPEPQTNIEFLKDVFLDVCRFIHREGIIWVEYCAKVEKIPYGNKMFLRKITNANGTVEEILANKEWILDDLIKSKEDTFPDFYFKFPGMRKMEKYAFAHKLGVFTINK